MPAAASPSPQRNFCFSEFLLDLFPFSEILPSSYRRTGWSQIASMQYFVVMVDYGRRGREAIVDPEITSREVISRIASGEYRNISFIHEIADCAVEDIAAEILSEAALPDVGATGADLQAGHFDHVRDLRKHERA
jgi:hypothetical protein